MILWAVLTVMTVLATTALIVPMLRWNETPDREGEIERLRGELERTDAKAASGELAPTAAATRRVRLQRKVLDAAADMPEQRPLRERLVLPVALAAAGLVAIAATGLYAALGRPDVANETLDAAAGHPGGDVDASIAQLESYLGANPSDADGWTTLGWSYMNVGRYAEAISAYARALEIMPGNPDLLAEQGQAITAAAGGQVTPEAQAVFRQALAADPDHAPARYFLALAKDQAGDREAAMDDWIAVISDAPEGAPWVGEIRARVLEIADERGIDISDRLPTSLAGVPRAGPTAADVAAAQQLSAAEQQAMIQNMVDSLALRLAANPRDAEGWATLMRSRMNLGQSEEAAQAYARAQDVFAGDQAEQTMLRQAARELGVPGA
jgi:cytochrome c-type biogenesis protein CcmH